MNPFKLQNENHGLTRFSVIIVNLQCICIRMIKYTTCIVFKAEHKNNKDCLSKQNIIDVFSIYIFLPKF